MKTPPWLGHEGVIFGWDRGSARDTGHVHVIDVARYRAPPWASFREPAVLSLKEPLSAAQGQLARRRGAVQGDPLVIYRREVPVDEKGEHVIASSVGT